MARKLVLFDKIYNVNTEQNHRSLSYKYLKTLQSLTKGFPNTKIKLNKLREFDQRYEVIINGPEEQFVYNLLKKQLGSITEFEDVHKGMTCKGTMVDVGKVGFGIFVDCAIVKPNTDVFISLHTLREHLCQGKKIPLKKIIQTYEFEEHFPVHVKIIGMDDPKKEIQAELADPSLQLFQKIVDEKIEGLMALGSTKSQFKKSLIKTGHLRDIITLEKFSFLEHVVLFKQGTQAPGIIKEIGRDLPGCTFSALRYQKIGKLFS